MKYVHGTRGALMASAAMGLLVTGFAARADATPAPKKIDTDSSSSVVQDGTGLASAGQIAGFIANHLMGGTGGTGTQTSTGPMTGVAAGDGAAAAGTLWFNAGAMRVDDSHAGANYDGDIYNAVLGYDVALTDSLTLGLAGGYEPVGRVRSGQRRIGRDGDKCVQLWVARRDPGETRLGQLAARHAARV